MGGVMFRLRYSRVNAAVLGSFGLGPSRSSVVVADDTVTVTMGWAFSVTIDRAAIAASRDVGRVWGWGVHGWRGRWLVNGSSTGLVRFHIDPPARARSAFLRIRLAELRISVDRPDALLAAVA